MPGILYPKLRLSLGRIAGVLHQHSRPSLGRRSTVPTRSNMVVKVRQNFRSSLSSIAEVLHQHSRSVLMSDLPSHSDHRTLFPGMAPAPPVKPDLQ